MCYPAPLGNVSYAVDLDKFGRIIEADLSRVYRKNQHEYDIIKQLADAIKNSEQKQFTYKNVNEGLPVANAYKQLVIKSLYHALGGRSAMGKKFDIFRGMAMKEVSRLLQTGKAGFVESVEGHRLDAGKDEICDWISHYYAERDLGPADYYSHMDDLEKKSVAERFYESHHLGHPPSDDISYDDAMGSLAAAFMGKSQRQLAAIYWNVREGRRKKPAAQKTPMPQVRQKPAVQLSLAI